MKFVDALNSIHSNVWGVLLIVLGIALMLRGHNAEGTVITTGGFALVRSQSSEVAKGTQ